MKQPSVQTLLLFLVLSSQISAQISFSPRTDLLTPRKHYSGIAIAVLDVNDDGRDDIARLNKGLEANIAYQTAPNAPFASKLVGEVSYSSQWGMCAGDLDNNGFADVVTGGFYDGIKFAKANASGSQYNIETILNPETFSQCINLVDMNNDGWLDAFVCSDDTTSLVFLNDGAGKMLYAPNAIDLNTLPASDNSGNYGSVWSDVDNDGDVDLYIAKCRQGVDDPTDGRRINQLFWNNGDGTFTQDLTNVSGLRIGAQSWTADFGDIDNDGDFDCFITNHDVLSQILENDGAGHFTDISLAAGFDESTFTGTPLQGVFRDFDNDGYVDILTAGSKHQLFRNNGDKTFTLVEGLFNTNHMESYGIGDLNSDGFMDIYAGYAVIYTDPSNKPDVLWLNNGNNNHYFGLHLRGVQSNRSAVGAKAFLYNALGKQVREVRAGESYGIANSMNLHFGLGETTGIDSVVVQWPSGQTDVLINPAIDQYATLQEGGCFVPAIGLALSGAATFCSGDSVTLTAPDGYAYKWNNGSAQAFFTAKTSGVYDVTVTTAQGCTAVSNAVAVTVNPVQIPTITLGGDKTICKGAAVTLTASPAASYLWSNGETSQSIQADKPGPYTVTIQGLCEKFTSAPQPVIVLEAPLPVPAPDTVALDAPAYLLSTGDTPLWYDAPTGGNLLFSGSPFVTPLLGASTTYWVANDKIFDKPNASVGMKEFTGGDTLGNIFVNGQLIFDCFEPFRLARVKMYAAFGAERKIDLFDGNGELIDTKTVFVPEGGNMIDLGFDIPVGEDLALTTDELFNELTLGTLSPQLFRSAEDVFYPYEIPGYVSIKASNFDLERYYYFYDWDVDFYQYECVSDRVPVQAVVDSTLVAAPVPADALPLKVYPNPASELVYLDVEKFAGGPVSLTLKNAQGAALRKQQMEWPGGRISETFDASGLPKGIYWLELRTEKGVVRRKIVLQ